MRPPQLDAVLLLAFLTPSLLSALQDGVDGCSLDASDEVTALFQVTKQLVSASKREAIVDSLAKQALADAQEDSMPSLDVSTLVGLEDDDDASQADLDLNDAAELHVDYPQRIVQTPKDLSFVEEQRHNMVFEDALDEIDEDIQLKKAALAVEEFGNLDDSHDFEVASDDSDFEQGFPDVAGWFNKTVQAVKPFAHQAAQVVMTTSAAAKQPVAQPAVAQPTTAQPFVQPTAQPAMTTAPTLQNGVNNSIGSIVGPLIAVVAVILCCGLAVLALTKSDASFFSGFFGASAAKQQQQRNAEAAGFGDDCDDYDYVCDDDPYEQYGPENGEFADDVPGESGDAELQAPWGTPPQTADEKP